MWNLLPVLFYLIPVLYYEMCWIYLGGVELRLHLFWVVDVHFIEPWGLFEILRSAFQVQPCQMGHLQGWDHHPEAECFGLDRVFKGCQRVKKQICIYIDGPLMVPIITKTMSNRFKLIDAMFFDVFCIFWRSFKVCFFWFKKS